MENLVVWTLYFFSFYAFLPAFISRTFGFRVFKKGLVKKEIALTFDDGPDAVYTPKLLELLARYDAKATFFIVGAHGEAHPELLRKIHEEGHTLGIHNYVHRTNWFMRPRSVKRQIERTCEIIREATGSRSNYYRPPWGIINVFDFAGIGHLQIVLWSSMFGDWNKRLGAERLKRKMLKKLRPGEVLLLHDCGQTPGAHHEAPANMLVALEAYLQEGRKQGYRFVAIEEMIKLTERAKERQQSWWKKSLITLWLQYERVFHLLFQLKQVGEDSPPAFHYRTIAYSGQPIELADGQRLNKGDRVVELHFDNRKLSGIAAEAATPLAAGIRMLREVEAALPMLASQLARDPAAGEAKALYGITMIHQGADRFGFEVFPLPNGLFARTTRIYLRLLMRVLTKKQRNKKSKQRRKALDPCLLLMPMSKMQAYQNMQAALLRVSSGQEANLHKTQTAAVESVSVDGSTSVI
ncbi:xylanase deacetylase [Paenibacillus sp. BIHB 4019]|uniref:Xylanase deacetylase n=1 Tax=Paenibacillus sp. BIHB 4019 TaxID=1870819 RepID=A0A1B2DTP7_9BACL|nr:polysaccharide deacetylase family protein [Paenibacillus sp. BIHB 4019]ANY71086.1 xylanase deacetylase [Paenibacillus sp. BIHB 4019]